MEDLHSVHDRACESQQAAQKPAVLQDYVGRAVRACLVNGSVREGYVYSVDPETGSAAMLVKVGILTLV